MSTQRSRPRLRDVAEAAGVTPSIASRILNADPTLSARPETRRRVLAAARQLGYTPNAFARGLKLQRTTTLGLVLPNIAHAVNAELILGAERRAAASGYVVLLADAEDFARNGEVHRRILLERRVDGLLVASATSGDGLVEDLTRHGIPYVLLNRRSTKGALSVSADDAAGMGLAVEHLAGLGHLRIGHIAGPQNTDTASRRREGYEQAMERLGLSAGPEAVAGDAFTEEGGFQAMTRLLANPQPPTAVAVASIAMSVGAMAAVRRAGLGVPRDVSVVAFHDAPMAEYLDPPLTSVRMPLREMAEIAVDLLVKLIAGEEVEEVVVPTPPALVVRESTAPPAVGP